MAKYWAFARMEAASAVHKDKPHDNENACHNISKLLSEQQLRKGSCSLSVRSTCSDPELISHVSLRRKALSRSCYLVRDIYAAP